MVTVATNLEAPVKIKIPNGERMSILGLGDIVLPGTLVSWALKFDVDKFLRSTNINQNSIKSLTKNTPYFLALLIGYSIGIICTLISMLVMNHPQPALLFLVPAVTLSLLITGLFKRQIKELF